MLKINHDTGYWYFTIYRKGQWKFSRVGSRLWPCIVDTVKYLIK